MKYPKRPSPALWAKLKPLVREKRGEPTPAEALLWERLRRKQIHGERFRRQYVFERFIVDFYCPAALLVVEVDGEIHQQQKDYDAFRTEFLEALGLQVVRFTNDEVFDDIEHVVEQIELLVKVGVQRVSDGDV